MKWNNKTLEQKIRYKMKQGQISVQTENIFPIIKRFLYSDQEIFLRELIANAMDATSKLETLSRKGELEGELGSTRIEIIMDSDASTLTIRDRGIGMTAEEVEKYLNQVAFSSAEEFVKKYEAHNTIIGHFGLGFYSAFMVADKVEVITKSYKEAPSAHWICMGDPSYSIQEGERTERGTDIILHISEDSKEFLEKDRIEGLLSKYCKFLPYEIQFGTKTRTEFEGEGDDRKEVEITEDNVINNPNPAWKKAPSELSDEDYKSFYRELYPFGPEPLFHIHLNIDYPFNLTGVLYFPKLNNSLEVQKNKIQLYSNQMFVTDDVKEIVPEFLTLLHGVIDSPDIPLNVSRSYLQADSNVKKISGYITKKVADKLKEIFKNDRKDFESKWKDLGVFVKYGMLSDEKFYEKSLDYALLANVDNEFFTIEEYKEKIKASQTDKHDKLIHIYTNNPTEHDSYIKAAKQRGYDVLEFDNIIDNHFIQHIEHKLSDATFVRVDSDITDNLVQTEDERESVLSDKEQEKIKTLFEAQIKGEGLSIALKALTPTDQPVLITRPEFLRRMKEMQSLQGMGMDAFPESYNVVVNSNHPLIGEKLLKMRNEEKKSEFVNHLYNLARLNQGMLKGEELTSFINKSIDYLKK